MRSEVMLDIFAGLIPGGGIGRYVRDLCAALLHQPGAPPARFSYPRNFRSRARAAYPGDRLHEIPLAWWQLRMFYVAGTRLPLRFDRWFDSPAVVHSPVGYGPTFRQARLIAHVHDLTTIEHPEWHPYKANQLLRATLPHAARHADVVLTHSAFVGRRAVEVLGVDPRRVVTIPPPLGHAFTPVSREAARRRVSERFGLEGDFILHVSTIEPRKNHVRLIGAFERLRRAGFRGPLVLVGQDGWKVAPIAARMESSPESRAILRIRDANDDDLVALYGACTLCAYPSLEEGFGMPLLESMACAAPCVTSDHESLIELGQGYALAVPALDEVALGDAFIALWRDPERRRAMAADGPERASAYRWERWAQRTFELYRRELSVAGA